MSYMEKQSPTEGAFLRKLVAVAASIASLGIIGFATVPAAQAAPAKIAATPTTQYLVNSGGDGDMWANGTNLWTSHSNKTEMTVDLTANGTTNNYSTQLVDASGQCFGPVNHSGNWDVQALSATDCSNDVARSQWYVVPAGAAYTFQSVYMQFDDTSSPCYNTLSVALLTPEGSGTQSQVTCVGGLPPVINQFTTG